jgi:hypothetical protein
MIAAKVNKGGTLLLRNCYEGNTRFAYYFRCLSHIANMSAQVCSEAMVS